MCFERLNSIKFTKHLYYFYYFWQFLGPEYKRELATFEKVTSDPLLRDPYESKMVEATRSKVPGANEGLYAKIRIEPNTTLAFYNGKRIKPKSKDDYDHPDWEKVI